MSFLLGAALFFPWWPAIPATPANVPALSQSDIHVTLSDSYLARLIGDRVSQRGVMNVTAMTITSTPPHILVVRVQVGIGSVATPLTLETQPVAQNGTVVVRVLEARVGPLPIPAPVTSLLTRNLNGSLRGLLGQHARAKGVQVTRSGVEIDADYQ